MGSLSHLSQTDTIMWTVEADPLLRSTIAAIAVLDHAPPWERVRERVAWAVARVAPLRHRVEAAPLHPTTLQWVPVDEVDLGYHLRHHVLPGPGTTAQLLEFARAEAARGFDRERPLWEFTLIEGLEDGRAAFLVKAHHVVSDGIGSVQLAAHLFDLAADPGAIDPIGEHGQRTDEAGSDASGVLRTDAEVPGWYARWQRAVRHDVDALASTARSRLRSLLPDAVHALRHPIEAVDASVETARSVYRVVAPALDTKSPVMTKRHLTTRYQVLEVPLPVLRAAAKRAGGTLNDAYLAGITGGLRRYHERHGAVADELRVAMPISLRTEDDDAGGNHVTVLRFSVPVGEPDARIRLGALHDIGLRLRGERSLAHTGTIAAALNLVPRPVIGSMLKHVDFLASNVPGMPVPIHLAGARVERLFPFGPTAGSSVNVTLMSYCGVCCIGVHSDTAAIPDAEEFIESMAAGFDEVLALAM